MGFEWHKCADVGCQTLQVLMPLSKPIKLVFAFLTSISTAACSQEYDILIKNGRLIDPKNEINQLMDVAIVDDKVVKVAQDISSKESGIVIDATGLLVTPGLIDIHAHVFVGSNPNTFANGFSSVSPDDFTFRSGVTTIVDAGTSGWRNFPDFKKQVIDQSKTRVLAFLNIAGYGMRGAPLEEEIDDMDAEKTAQIIKQYSNIIIGTKLGHYNGTEWTPFERAQEAGRLADVPMLLECHLVELPLNELLNRMRPGDIFSHAYGKVTDRVSVIDAGGMLKPFVVKAKEKGIRFDVGHGGGSFHFSEAIPAVDQGLYPDSFGTDLHRFSMNSGMKDMLNIMSKFLNIGMSLEDIIHRATWNSAKSLHREELGHLSEGVVADIAILSMPKGNFGFIDSGGIRINGNRKLVAELTIREGKVVWDLNGLSAKDIE